MPVPLPSLIDRAVGTSIAASFSVAIVSICYKSVPAPPIVNQQIVAATPPSALPASRAEARS